MNRAEIRSQIKQKLEKKGCRFIEDADGKTVKAILAKSSCGEYQIEITQSGIAASGRRVYCIYERNIKTGKLIGGMFSKEKMLSVSMMHEKGRIWSIIAEMYGDYENDKESILECIGNIEEGRVLDFNEDIECNKLRESDILEKIKEYMLERPLYDMFIVLKIKGETKIAISSGEKGFDSLFKKLAPDNDILQFKAVCKNEGYLRTDAEKSRYTYKIERNKALQYGLSSNQVFLFNFDREFIQEYLRIKEIRKREKQPMETAEQEAGTVLKQTVWEVTLDGKGRRPSSLLRR